MHRAARAAGLRARVARRGRRRPVAWQALADSWGSGRAAGAAGVGGAAGRRRHGRTWRSGRQRGRGGAAGGAGAGGVAGAAGAAGAPAGLAPPAPSGLAVLNIASDYMSSSVSILNPQGGLVRGDCVHSMSVGAGSLTISGDVALPSQPQRGGQVVLLDRGNSALTFVNPTTCAIDRQMSVKGGTFQKPNPHDVVIVSDSKAYVTRYEKNAGVRYADGGR